MIEDFDEIHPHNYSVEHNFEEHDPDSLLDYDPVQKMLEKSNESSQPVKRPQSKLGRTIRYKTGLMNNRENMSDRTPSNFVAGLMAHTPCGPSVPNVKQSCWQYGRCEKKFPKPQVDFTDTSIEGYPHYRRRIFVNVESKLEMPFKQKMIHGHKFKFDNAQIPAYNMAMSLRWRYHMNVECAYGFSTMAYLFDYIHKGTDKGYVEIKEFEDTKDEITLHKYGRVMTSDEAHWDISKFAMSAVNPTVKRLGYFIPDQKKVVVNQGEVLDEEMLEEQRRETAYPI